MPIRRGMASFFQGVGAIRGAGPAQREGGGRPRADVRLDWSRLGGRCLVAVLAILAIVQLYRQARGQEYGYDFHGGTWSAGRAWLEGRSPFGVPRPAWLLAHSNSFITPPTLAVLGALFSLLPFAAAIVTFNAVCVIALVAALRLLGVRSVGGALVALCSFPFVASLCLGQPDGLFVLGAAIAWRERGTWRGALAGALIIAAKLLAWPLIVWLLVTRRYRQAALMTGMTVAILLICWAPIGFAGLGSYPRLLSADARAFGTNTHSVLTALVRSGAAVPVSNVLTVVIAVAVAALIVVISRRTDLGWFTAALALGILVSPVLWQHYLLLFFVPLAATGRLRDPLTCVLTLALWLSPSETPASLTQAWLIPVLAIAIAIRIAVLSRDEPLSGASQTITRP